MPKYCVPQNKIYTFFFFLKFTFPSVFFLVCSSVCRYMEGQRHYMQTSCQTKYRKRSLNLGELNNRKKIFCKRVMQEIKCTLHMPSQCFCITVEMVGVSVHK